MNYVFYKGALFKEYDPSIDAQRGPLPKYSWVYNSEQRRWHYMHTEHSSYGLPADEVPAEYRALLLLINPPST